MRECFLKKNKAVPCFSDLKTQFCAQNTALLLGPQTMSLQLKMFTSLNVNPCSEKHTFIPVSGEHAYHNGYCNAGGTRFHDNNQLFIPYQKSYWPV